MKLISFWKSDSRPVGLVMIDVGVNSPVNGSCSSLVQLTVHDKTPARSPSRGWRSSKKSQTERNLDKQRQSSGQFAVIHELL
jgi:hypothetical protein